MAIKMKKILVLLAVLVLVAMMVLGCTRGPNYNYPTGNTAYGQQGQQPYQGGYVGGGCAVDGPDSGIELDVSEPIMAA